MRGGIQPSMLHTGSRTCLDIRQIGLTFSSGQQSVTALEDISLQAAENEFAVIVGPSGCGKSSLLYLTAGLIEPTSGEIRVNDKRIDGPGADRGMVFQAYTLFPWLNVRDNVEYGLKRRRLPAAQRKEIVEYYLREVGLERFADAWPRQLSGGMMQRVAIARALANDPDILLMDEPFGALDSQTRLSMQQLLLNVWGHNSKTVLFVTHDIDEAILLADRIYVMSGRPGVISRTIEVHLPRPRTSEIVMEKHFLDIKREILGILHHDDT
ncbi:ABC transporter ATP-binding protein [Salinicola corii]|uniref:ABC transporter ATP-binding protein n=2 Tax=Salinicola corii TaxID=2606937 RepID=A0A640WEG8_9GAMM|nr:ABC transporter ATP-binding protein [Salinicola corii]